MLRFFTVAFGAVALHAGCVTPQSERQVVPSYDASSRQLLQLSADQNGDGRIDQWTYLDGNRVLRGEADVDGDGRIDRWEYFNGGSLAIIGSSSRNDGVEDTWTTPAATLGGQTHVAIASQRDRRRDRHEYFSGDTLQRVEEDTNGDGLIDKWNRYQDGVIREVAFDLSFSKGQPDRRAVYDPQGRFVGIEIDPDGDGTFESAPATAEAAAPSARYR